MFIDVVDVYRREKQICSVVIDIDDDYVLNTYWEDGGEEFDFDCSADIIQFCATEPFELWMDHNPLQSSETRNYLDSYRDYLIYMVGRSLETMKIDRLNKVIKALEATSFKDVYYNAVYARQYVMTNFINFEDIMQSFPNLFTDNKYRILSDDYVERIIVADKLLEGEITEEILKGLVLLRVDKEQFVSQNVDTRIIWKDKDILEKATEMLVSDFMKETFGE